MSKNMTPHAPDDCPQKGLTGARRILDDGLRRLLFDLSTYAAAAETDGDLIEAALARRLSGALAGRAPREHMLVCAQHDVIDDYNAGRSVLRAVGLPEDFGYCALCIREAKQ